VHEPYGLRSAASAAALALVAALLRAAVRGTLGPRAEEDLHIRIRDEGNKVTMSAKQHATDGKMDSQKEYETTVKDFDTTRQILLSAGLEQTGYQENKRETWEIIS
jgi:hypothetical protein